MKQSMIIKLCFKYSNCKFCPRNKKCLKEELEWEKKKCEKQTQKNRK